MKKNIKDSQKIRNITDYLYSCLSRLSEQADLMYYIGRHKDKFIEEGSKNSMPIIISMVDVYSRDVIITLGHIFDDDKKTSSLFTLVDYIKDEKIKKRYLNRLKRIKLSLNLIVRSRGNQVAHFNTNLNDIDNNLMQIHYPIQFDPRYIKKIKRRIENFYWDIKEEVGSDGVMSYWRGDTLSNSFSKLVCNYNKKPKI